MSAYEITLAERGFALLAGAAEIGRTGLVLNRELSFDEWTQLGAGLQRLEGGVQWALGDWINYGESRYGEKYTQAVDDTGYTYQGLADLAWVATRIAPSRRRERLRFSHHREVAALEPDEQDQLLAAADEGRWSVQAIRESVRTFKAQLTSGTSEPEVPTPTRELPVKVTVSTPKPEHEPDPVEGLQSELRAAERQIGQLEAELKSMEADDTHREIRSLHSRLAQLEARLNALLTEKNEAVKQAEYYGKLLKKIAKMVGVEKYSDIAATLESKLAA